jgi:ABC-type transport system substrate-binding protein
MLLTPVTWVIDAAAQPPDKKPPLEEEETPAKRVKPRKPPPRVPDDDEAQPAPAKPADKNSPLTISVLAEAAKQTDLAPEARKLFQGLAIPFDRMTLDGRDKIVAPIASYWGSGDKIPKTISLQFLDLDKGTLAPPHSVPGKEISGVEPFEKIALDSVEAYLQAHPVREPPEARTPVGRVQKLQVAEKALAAVVRFHESARESRRRDGDGWDALKNRLSGRLLAVQLEQLRALADTANWKDAFILADRLKVYRDPKTQAEFAKPLAQLVNQSLQQGDFPQVHIRLKALEDLFPSSSVTEPIREKLRKEAADRLEKARSEKSPARSLELLNQAEQIWPSAESRTYRRELSKGTLAILGVGVRDLPKLCSPGFAQTDVEKLAVDLMFESLVKPVWDPVFGQLLEPGLAVGRPRVIPLGREFKISPEAYWADGNRVTAMDVKGTVELLRTPGWPGYRPTWAQLIAEPPPITDASQVSVTLQQGYLVPLSLMTFKVLPSPSGAQVRPDSVEFARHPVGSGPFQLPERGADRAAGEEEEVRFTANPFYRRSGKGDQPYIRDIRFFRSKDPVTDMSVGKLHLLLEPSLEDLKRFNSLANAKVYALPNRRIYFLAVNHRNPTLQNTELRKALAHAIDRNTILNDRFRAGLKWDTVPHRALNGPFPPGSWACQGPPKLRADLYEKGLASRFKSTGSGLTLTLKYPSDDPVVEKACEDIRDQVLKNAGIQLQLLARPARQLRTEVEDQFDYELAYCHFDYGSDAYWLWPLFNTDARALESGGGNYLGYQNDSDLQKKFRQAMSHREFASVQGFQRDIHVLFYQKMPLIPLWQLDTLLVVSQDLKAVGIDPQSVDPLHLFANIAEWKLENK